MTSAEQQQDDGAIVIEPSKEEFSWPPLESNPDVLTVRMMKCVTPFPSIFAKLNARGEISHRSIVSLHLYSNKPDSILYLPQKYLHSIGLPETFSIGEVFGFDEDLLAFVPQPVHGIIVCHERLIPKSEYRSRDLGSADDYDMVKYYMHQSGSLDNACGIIACIHAAFNSPMSIAYDPNSVLGRFRTSTSSLSPRERCAALENNEEFRMIHAAHASEGQSEVITNDQSRVRHHYVAYVLGGGGGSTDLLVELDGTKAGPVILGGCDGDLLRGSIREVMGKLERGEISESLSMMTLNLSQE
jgi:ubiquitin carboxyl-terminal hydrolase L3